MLLKILYLFLKIILLFMIVVLSGVIVLLLPFIFICITLESYGFVLSSVLLLFVCFYVIYQGMKEFKELTLSSLYKRLPSKK
ncbi:hypothetical protein [Enterococcus sp. DIV1758]|uniref:hypothetical protein n=1 Tax=Enterococcus sp. DIV1758 TaxID=2774744 RepID=UPI003F231F0D